MRFFVLFLGLIGLIAAPALADVTLRYKVKDQAEKAITVSVADNGNARFDSGDGTVLIARDGQRYFVASDQQGPLVGRLEDGLVIVNEVVSMLLAVLEAVAEEAASTQGASQPTGVLVQLRAMVAAPYAAQSRGTESVGGRTGTLYVIGPEQGGAQGPPLEVVIATDPDLAPVARELRQLVSLVAQTAVMLFGQTPDLLTELDGLLARGVPIRIGQQFRLDTVSAEPVPESSFELPGPVMTLDQLRARSPLNALAGGEAETEPGPAADDE